MYEELSKHGYSKRDSGTTLVFTSIEKLKNAASTDDLSRVIDTYAELVKYVMENRTASMGVINALRMIGEYILDNGLEGLMDYLNQLYDKYDRACWDAARIAANRIEDGDVLMTISNSLCVRRVFKVLVDEGIKYEVYVLESRPGMEGLDTASYLNDLGVKTYLVVDSAARFFLKNCDKVVVGAEAIAVNGAVVGKVGTSLLSLAANESRVRVFVVAPLYKFSPETIHGELLKLPEGDWHLLMSPDIREKLPKNYRARAPIYDVTPPNLIDAIATEYGLFAPQAVPVVIRQYYGIFPPKLRTLEGIISELKSRR